MSGKLKILHLEDNANDVELIRSLIDQENYDFELDRVNTREEFISALNARKYDLILSDYSLPAFDGLSALKVRQQICPEVPFILVSGSIGEERAIEALKGGATDYVMKEHLQRLLPSVSRALEEAWVRKERLKAEQKLKQASERFLHLVNSSPSVIYSSTVGPEHTCTFVSENFQDMFGYPSVKMIGSPKFWFTHLHPDDRNAVIEQVESQLQENKNGSVEYRFKNINGDYRWIYDSFSLCYDQLGIPTEIVGSWTDITAYKETFEEAKRLTAAINSTVESILITDTNGSILYVNPAFTQITGYSYDEVIGRKPNILKSERQNPEIYPKLWETIRKGNIFKATFINKNKAGEDYYSEQTITPIQDDTGRIAEFISVSRDITDRVNMENQLRQSQKMEAVGQLSGGIAHDFNNRLTVIMGNLQLLERCVKDDASALKLVYSAINSAKGAAKLTADLLTFSRRQMLDVRSFDVNEHLQSLKDMLARTLGETIEVQYALEETPLSVRTDSGEFENAILNLAVNARDAMPGGGRLTLESYGYVIGEDDIARYPYMKQGDYTVVAISDTGCGMPREVIDRCFEPFFTTKKEGKGTGLGLAMVYGFVKQSGGFIHVYSEKDHGTCIKLYLPRTTTATPADTEDKRGIGLTDLTAGAKPITVLVVEDDPEVRAIATSLITDLGYRVLEAKDGPSALAVFDREQGIDLVFSDMVMPGGMNGVEMITKLRERRPGLKAIIASGYSRNSLSAKEDGIFWIRKPYTKEVLAEKFSAILIGKTTYAKKMVTTN